MNVATWADRHRQRFGDFPAVIATEAAGETVLGSAEVHDRACRFAAALVATGVLPGDRVALWLPSSPELVVGFSGVLRAGAAAVVVSDAAPAAEAERIFADCGATRVIRAPLPAGDHPPLIAPVARAPDDVAQIVYTSGTTGEPKGVVWRHGTVAARFAPFAAAERDPGAPPRRVLSVLPPSGAFGTQYLYLRMLQKLTHVLVERFEPERVIAEIERRRIEMAWLVPAMCEALLAVPGVERRDLSSLASVSVGGAEVSPSLIERFRRRLGIRLRVTYGLTELGQVALGAPGATGSVGRPRAGVEVRIAADGEVEVAAGAMRAEYLHGGSASQWVATGDLGFLDQAGELHLLGRKQDVIVQAGSNLHPRAIANAVAELPGVSDCAVVGVPDEVLGEAAVACVVGDGSLTAEEVLAHCRARLDGRRIPARIRFVEAIPRTSAGKLDANALRALPAVASDLAERLRRAAPRARRGLLLDEVRGRLARLVPAFDETRSFGELGLDSLGAVAFANLLGEALGRPIPATVTFNHPTPRALVDHLLQGKDGESAPRPAPARGGPIAIVGAACRLPGGADTPERLWDLLRAGHDFTGEITRWRLDPRFRPRRAALLDPLPAVDANFFGLAPAEARGLDVQHRLLLEVAWEALERAGHDPTRPGHTGVFLGISGASGGGAITALPAMAVGRLARFLDLHGPAVSFDTTCSSSLVAVHHAMAALRAGECDLALAGGVSVIPSPRSFVALAQLGVLAADGRCKAFAAAADGFGRGEGCVLLVLRRLDDALADGDQVIAVLTGSAVNHDGKSASLTAPNGRAQEALIRAALADAGRAPDDVSFLEAHGTGTALGDPIEVEAALAGRSRPLIIGSVKANLGHLEAAAGAVGLLKAALAVERGEIPPQLHVGELNRLLPGGLVIPREPAAWPAGRARVAGVTSLGMSGTNAHVIVEAAPATAVGDEPARPEILVLSARSQAALAEQARAWGACLPHVDFADACFTAAVGRAHFQHRLAVASAEGLAAAAMGLAAPAKVAFLYTGQGAQVAGMGRQLYGEEPVFRAALDRCARIVPLDGPQPALFALEWALSELWRSWGVVPDMVAGHSLGELVAACVAGVLGLEDGLRLAHERGRLMASLPAGGAMLSLPVAADRLRHEDIDIAAENGAESTVISGPAAAVAAVAARLGVAGRRLDVDTAFHSRLIDPILDELERAAARIRFHPPRIPLVSTLAAPRVTEASHWRRGARETVRFHAAIHALVAQGATVFVENGPSPVLLALARRELEGRTWVATLRDGRGGRAELLAGLGQLYVAGVDPDWHGVHAGRRRRRIPLPTYPFQRPRPAERARSGSLAEGLRDLAADLLGAPPGDDDDLLDRGLDSLRLLELLAEARRRWGIVATPEEFLARPTLAGLAGKRGLVSPLLVLRAGGEGTPLVCVHPAGGRVAAYLRLRERAPLYALQSRALAAPEREHATIAAMAADYAACLPAGRVRLLGWSMGGVIAHAMAGLVPDRVDQVTLVDPPEPGVPVELDALHAVVLDLNPAAGEVPRQGRPQRDEELFAWCVARGLLPGDTPGFDAALALYRRHLELLRDHRPAAVAVPMSVFWAEPRPRSAWRALGAAQETVVGGTHHTVMGSPLILSSAAPGSVR